MFLKTNITTLLAALVLWASPAHAAPLYSITALPPSTYANAINSAGQVVGQFGVGGEGHAFSWSGGVLTDLGMAGATSTAQAVSSNGLVAGYTVTGDAIRAFLRNGAGTTALGTLGGDRSFGLGVNASGHVVGQSTNAANESRGFLYSGGEMRDIGTLGGDFALAAGINNAGQVVGEAALDSGPLSTVHAFIFQDGAMRDIGTLGGRQSSAAAISEGGHVTGYAYTPGSVEHAFLYVDDMMIDLGTLGGGRSYGYGVNALGQVVGGSSLEGDFDTRAFLYSGGAMTDLNSLIDPSSGWVLYEARGINDLGQIAALGCLGDNCQAVLLDVVPQVPEPASVTLVLAGLGLLAAQRASAAFRRA